LIVIAKKVPRLSVCHKGSWYLSVLLLQVAESNGEKTKFKSSIFGSLGTGVVVGPNTINFDTVFADFDKKLLENIHVVATVLGIIVAYFVAVPVVRRLDKKDALKVH
jgi:predicted membrane protein